MRKPLIVVLALLLNAAPVVVSACSPPPMSSVEEEAADRASFLERARRATAIVEVEALQTALWSDKRRATVKIVRVFRGTVPLHARLPLVVYPGSMCGRERVEKGQRAYLILDQGLDLKARGRCYITDVEFLQKDQIDLLVSANVISI